MWKHVGATRNIVLIRSFSADHFQVSFQSLQLGVEEPLDRIGLKACMTILQRKGRIFLIITLS